MACLLERPLLNPGVSARDGSDIYALAVHFITAWRLK
jgi:hypothetical protein